MAVGCSLAALPVVWRSIHRLLVDRSAAYRQKIIFAYRLVSFFIKPKEQKLLDYSLHNCVVSSSSL